MQLMQQSLRHRYVVTQLDAPRLLVMQSLGSRIIDRSSGSVTAEIDVWVYFDLRAVDGGRTEMSQTVVMHMGNPFYKAMIDVLGTLSGDRALWERQFEEELENLAAFAEAHSVSPFENDG